MPANTHPVIAAYAATGALIRAFESAPQPRSELIECAIALGDAFAGKVDSEETFKRAERVSGDGEDVGLYIAFLDQWCSLAGKHRRLKEVTVLAKRARELLPADAIPELRDLVLSMEGISAAASGDQAARERLIRESLKTLPAESGCRPIRLINLAMLLAASGRIAEIEPELLTMKQHHPERGVRSGCAMMLFMDRAETGRGREAIDFLREFEDDNVLWARYGNTAAHWMMLVDFTERQWTGEGMPEALLARIPAARRVPDWLMVCEALASRRPGDALKLARAMGEQRSGSLITEPSFASYSLVRAELSCGNAQAARRLIELRHGRGNRGWLDDLFLARAALLEGDYSQAAKLLAAARESAARNHAEGRVELELHLAVELSAGRMLRVMRVTEPSPAAEKDDMPAAAHGAADDESREAVERLVGTGAAMSRIRSMVRHVAPLDVPVLISGETGTGKELVARAIHDCSPRANETFLAVDCGAISETLLESELFGHERGSFTGAVGAHRGLFEEAGKGTLLLDEVGNIPPRLQAALLRVLETAEVRPVGSNRPKKVACRVLAATNANLEELCARGLFRQDLLFRLKRLEISLPPLRERPEDIPALAGMFLREGRTDGRSPAMSEDLCSRLCDLPWPGNVRELRNTIEHMRLLNSDKLSYSLSDLPVRPAGTGELRQTEAPAKPPPADAKGPEGRIADTAVAKFLAEQESPLRRKERLRMLFREHRSLTRVEVARVLGVSAVTAGKYLKELCKEGLIRKVAPNASPQSHYFTINSV